LLVEAMVTQVRPVELRYYLGQAHFRSGIEYSPEALGEAVAAYRRIENFVTRATEVSSPVDEPGDEPVALVSALVEAEASGAADAGPEPAPARELLPAAFTAAMDDDLGVPQALAVVHDAVRAGNNALAAGDVPGTLARLSEVRAMLGVLGFDPLAEPWATAGSGDDLYPVVSALVAVTLSQRQAARERRDFDAADAIRDELSAAGIFIEDRPDGPHWELKR
jgi:cysteinyl-tRNA synthetase